MKSTMGVGTIYLMGAELAFIFANYGVHIVLAKFLGVELYGVFGVLMSLYLINRAFLNAGVPRAVSKFLAEKVNSGLIKKSIYLQLTLACLFALIYIVFSKQIAWLLKDASLVPYIIILGVIVIPLAFVSLYLSGFYNGLRLFKRQAAIKIIFSLLRFAFILLSVIIGFKIFGFLFSYLLATLITLWLCWKCTKFKTIKGSFNTKKILKFAIPITISSLAFTLIRNVNVLFIKSLLENNTLSGYYTAASTLASVPYMIFTALPLTLTPSISKAVKDGRLELVKKYIRQSMRYILLLLLPITAITIATSKELINLFYSAEYSTAGPILNILIISAVFLTVFSTLSSVITGSGKPKVEMWVAIVFVLVLSILNYILIPLFEMKGAAYSLLLTSLFSAILVGGYVIKKYETLIEIRSLMRALTASLIVLIVGYLWHYEGIYLLISYFILGLLYLALLLLFNEVNKDDLLLVQKVFKGKNKV